MKKILIILLLLGVVFPMAAQQAAPSIITIGGENYYVYTVRPGDTFYSLGKQYTTTEQALRTSNPHLAEGLKAGQVIKIPVVRTEAPLSERKMNRLFDIHVVNQGETGYSISQRYGISLQTIIEDNPGFDPAHLSIGQKINIRIKSQGEADIDQIKQEINTYTAALNSVSTNFTYYAVRQGDTFYSLNRTLGVPADTLRKYNPAELKDGLKMGSILRIPVPGSAVAQPADALPATQPGQSLGTVSPQGQPATADTTLDELFAAGRAFRFKEMDITGPLRVALLLPLRVEAASQPQFLEFYQGFLLGLGELKAMGVTTEVDLFNTGRSLDGVRAVLANEALSKADLIVGPVYDDCFAPAADFATARGIPIVSPLGAIDPIESPAAFQVFPSARTKNEKLREEFSPDRNVIVISAASIDRELQAEVEPLLPPTAHRISHGAGLAQQIEKLLSSERENVLVVLAGNEQATDEILARISSVQNNLMARSLKNPVIKVVGSARWARYQNIDRSLYFKLNLRYITAYHADRGNPRVVDFDSRYVTEYSALPTQYAYRGYDVAKLFVGAIKLHGQRFLTYLNDRELPLLEVPYRFEQDRRGGKYLNQTWAKVCYNEHYTIEVK